MGLGQAMAMPDARLTAQPLGNRPPSQELTLASPQPSGSRPPSQALTPRNGLAPVTPMPELPQVSPLQSQRVMPDQANNPRRTSQLLPVIRDVEANKRGYGEEEATPTAQ